MFTGWTIRRNWTEADGLLKCVFMLITFVHNYIATFVSLIQLLWSVGHLCVLDNT